MKVVNSSATLNLVEFKAQYVELTSMLHFLLPVLYCFLNFSDLAADEKGKNTINIRKTSSN
jgi:hypothetical protein